MRACCDSRVKSARRAFEATPVRGQRIFGFQRERKDLPGFVEKRGRELLLKSPLLTAIITQPSTSLVKAIFYSAASITRGRKSRRGAS